MRRRAQRQLRNYRAGVKPKAIPGGTSKKTRHGLKSTTPNQRNLLEYQLEHYYKHLDKKTLSALKRVEKKMSDLHIRNPVERNKIMIACKNTLEQIQDLLLRRNGIDFATNSIRKKLEKIRSGDKSNVPENYQMNIASYVARLESKIRGGDQIIHQMEAQLTKIISNPPRVFKILFGKSAKTYWNHIRFVLIK